MVQGIKYISFAETGGYGLSALAYIRALLEGGIPITWHPLSNQQGRYQSVVDPSVVTGSMQDAGYGLQEACRVFRADIPYDVVIVHLFPESWPSYVEPGKRMIGYAVWETDTIPKHWPAIIDTYDGVLTPSRFCRDVFMHGGIASPVTTAPHVPVTRYPEPSPETRATFRNRYDIGPDTVVFYTINDWILRKAMWRTLHAYLLAFSATDDVVLFVKTGPFGERSQSMGAASTPWMLENIVANYPDPARIVLVTDRMSDEDIALLHTCSDVYLSLTCSEGWGMGAFEAARLGNPVIMTGWGGQTEFLPGEHACLVDYELKQVTEHLAHHEHQEELWAHANVDTAIDWMQRLHANEEERNRRGQGLKKYIDENFRAGSIIAGLVDAVNNYSA